MPAGATIPARFCLAADALRETSHKTAAILEQFVGAVDAQSQGMANAAASVLALLAQSRELHEKYRARVLEHHAEDSALWPVTAFLNNRYFRYHLLRAKLTRNERRGMDQYFGESTSTRIHVFDHYRPRTPKPLPAFELRTLDGKSLRLPDDTKGKITILAFVEPPADPNVRFPHNIGGTPPEGKRPLKPGIMHYLFQFVDEHARKDVQVVAAVLEDDVDRVRKRMDDNQWPCQVAIVPGGLRNPLVQQLGIFHADHIPNVFLIQRDGAVKWRVSGFDYKGDFGYPGAIRYALDGNIEALEIEQGIRALKAKDFKKALTMFTDPYPEKRDNRFRWAGPRLHGRALAQIGSKNWDAAETELQGAIETHRKHFGHGDETLCEALQELRRLHAVVLEHLGRTDDAAAARKQASASTVSHSSTPYVDVHRRLKVLGLVP